MSEEMRVEVGAAVVSRDGVRLGEVQDAGEDGVLVGREFGPLVRLPAACFAQAKTGGLLLRFDAADIRDAGRLPAVMGR